MTGNAIVVSINEYGIKAQFVNAVG